MTEDVVWKESENRARKKPLTLDILGKKFRKTIRRSFSLNKSGGKTDSVSKKLKFRPATEDDLKLRVDMEIFELVDGFKQKVFYKVKYSSTPGWITTGISSILKTST